LKPSAADTDGELHIEDVVRKVAIVRFAPYQWNSWGGRYVNRANSPVVWNVEPAKATSDVTDTVVLVDKIDYRAQLEDLQQGLDNIERPPETTLEILGQSRVER
jgi:hypothetical protein